MIQTQPIYNPLYLDKEHFIILITGGRGSGKSFNAAAFIERLTFELTPEERLVHNILYTRYTMISAAISVIPEMQEKIELDGTSKYFSVKSADIVNKMTGSHIMFRGIKTSSGNQTAKLKSIHGITTFVCDEAEEWTSEEDFDKIMLSIRQKGIQNRIIIIMNPTDSNHFIYRKYIEKTHKLVEYDGVPVQISTHPNVLHIHTTYLDNKEHLSEQFVKEVCDMKENAPEKYAHVVMGRWADVAEGAVFKKWGIVDEFPEEAKKQAIGLDFGYAQDPSAAIRCGIVDNRLYLDEIFYRKGMLARDLVEALRPYNLHVIADSADPRLIQEISLGGIIIYPVQKGPGSILAGIDKMQSLEIYVTRRSYNLQDEMRNYIWAKDKDGRYINEPEDHDNHGIDAGRYYVLGQLLGHVMKPKAVSKEDLGIF
jgi:phage terminase large subunit|nr:MAG TPA: terminase large subunit [Caudoviricetes sp.]